MSFIQPTSADTNSLAPSNNNPTPQVPVSGFSVRSASESASEPCTNTPLSDSQAQTATSSDGLSALLGGYSSAAPSTWQNTPSQSAISLEAMQEQTSARRREENTTAEDEEPVVRKRIGRSLLQASENDNSTNIHQIGSILCDKSNETNFTTIPEFTYANTFPEHRYTAEEVVKSCASMMFDRRFKDCQGGVKKVCEQLVKRLEGGHSNEYGKESLGTNGRNLVEFLKSQNNDKFKNLKSFANQTKHLSKIDEGNFLYFSTGTNTTQNISGGVTLTPINDFVFSDVAASKITSSDSITPKSLSLGKQSLNIKASYTFDYGELKHNLLSKKTRDLIIGTNTTSVTLNEDFQLSNSESASIKTDKTYLKNAHIDEGLNGNIQLSQFKITTIPVTIENA